ncbi:unnamed protein product [Rotaria magnacalcarata]|uniref:EGF-like domain-containing protein n=1 Tax=Rotaria magnacalcarata TaxID=392030 RepID=A0A816RFI2_9BILA|nr:unnamed protein product [Rotaria magnacalcarata]CAF2070589.1 unnamed protein product [Rotaria magnacalcarata]
MRSSFILIVVVLLLSTHIDAFRYRSARQLATAPSNIEVGRNNPNNICDYVPCDNGGTCFVDSNSVRCRCKSDFTGYYCEAPISILSV